MAQEKTNSFANTVVQRMTADAQFAGSLPLVVELKTRNTAYEAAVAAAADGGKKLTILKNEAFVSMLEQLDEVADAVEGLAKGDAKVALDAGFEMMAAPKSITFLPAPSGLIAINDDNRTCVALVKWKSLKGTMNYALEFQMEGETDWQKGPFSSSCSTSLTVPVAGKYYNVRIYAIGRSGLQSDVSDYVTVLVS